MYIKSKINGTGISEDKSYYVIDNIIMDDKGEGVVVQDDDNNRHFLSAGSFAHYDSKVVTLADLEGFEFCQGIHPQIIQILVMADGDIHIIGNEMYIINPSNRHTFKIAERK